MEKMRLATLSMMNIFTYDQFTFPLPDDRSEDHQPAAGRQLQDPGYHLIGALRRDWKTTPGTVGDSDAGEKKTKIVVDLGNGSDRRPNVPAGCLLLNGYRRRKPLNRFHVRLLHLFQKLAGVSGERFYVAALTFGIQGVECKAGFSRAAQAGDDGQSVSRDLQTQILQIVLSGSLYRDLVHGRIFYCAQPPLTGSSFSGFALSGSRSTDMISA